MRYFASLCLLILLVSSVFAGPVEQAKAKARACLLLEQEQRARQGVWKDLAAANAFSAETGKVEIVWVGSMDQQAVAAFPDAVHVQVENYAGSSQHRVIVPTANGYYWQIAPSPTAHVIQQIRTVINRRDQPHVFIRAAAPAVC